MHSMFISNVLHLHCDFLVADGYGRNTRRCCRLQIISYLCKHQVFLPPGQADDVAVEPTPNIPFPGKIEKSGIRQLA